MTSMAIVRQIAQYDVVELTEPVDAAPAGARGAVLELLNDGGVAEIEITEPTLDGLDRIVYAPVAKLRVVSSDKLADGRAVHICPSGLGRASSPGSG